MLPYLDKKPPKKELSTMNKTTTTFHKTLSKLNANSKNNIQNKTISTENGVHKRKLSSRHNTSDFSRNSFMNQFQSTNKNSYITEANKIMRERMKNRGQTLNTRARFRKALLQDSKEISLKNYLIGLLKEKRTNINEKEKNIRNALFDCENRLNTDHREFADFVEKTNKRMKLEEDTYLKYKTLNEEKNAIFSKEKIINKKLNEDLKQILKLIYRFNDYGNFIYKAANQEYWFKNLPEFDKRSTNIEEVSEIIINKFENVLYFNDYFSDDESLLIRKFKELEEKIIAALDKRSIMRKDFIVTQKYNEIEINDLKRKIQDNKEEGNVIYNDKIKTQKEIDDLESKDAIDYKKYLEYIVELGEATGELKFKASKKIEDYLIFTKCTLNVLQNKEKIVNKYIKEIEDIEINGDKKITEEIEYSLKKDKKREKLSLAKIKQDQIELLKRIKTVERSEKFVIKGRKVPICCPFYKKDKVKRIDKKVENDFDMLYYFDD